MESLDTAEARWRAGLCSWCVEEGVEISELRPDNKAVQARWSDRGGCWQ